MSTFDWTLAGPFLLVAALVAALITPSIVRDVREARRARTRPLPCPGHQFGAPFVDGAGQSWRACSRCGTTRRAA